MVEWRSFEQDGGNSSNIRFDMVEIADIGRAANQKDDVSHEEQRTERNPDHSRFYNLEEPVEDGRQDARIDQKAIPDAATTNIRWVLCIDID